VQWTAWSKAVPGALADWVARSPLDPAMPLAALAHPLRLPDVALAAPLASAAGLSVHDGRILAAAESLGPAEASVRQLEQRLAEQPFAAPEAAELDALRLGRRELAAAEKAGRLVRLGDVVLLPGVFEAAVRVLAALPQPFTTSQARQALDTTRRVAIPLLECLDERGDTERLDATLRRVR
jgi:selenocysteine-specific elongation factor